MSDRYNRNRIYLDKKDQDQLKECNLLFAGCGIGSNIAECAVRIGFENMTLIDGDVVEKSNLNRQNYVIENVGKSKANSLRERLLEINPDLNINISNEYLSEANLASTIAGHDIAINALDFQSNVPFCFDEICQNSGITVLHPYNFGWAALVFVITPNSPNLKSINSDYKGFEKQTADFVLGKLSFKDRMWVGKVLNSYKIERIKNPPPQLSVGSWLAGGVCTNILFRLRLGKPIKQFPEFYFVTIEE